MGDSCRRCADVPIDSAAAASCFQGVWVAGDSRRCAADAASHSAAAANRFQGVWVAGDSRRSVAGAASRSVAAANRFQGATVAGVATGCPDVPAAGGSSRGSRYRAVGVTVVRDRTGRCWMGRCLSALEWAC